MELLLTRADSLIAYLLLTEKLNLGFNIQIKKLADLYF